MILPSMGVITGDHCVLLAQAHFRLPLRRVLIHRHRSLLAFLRVGSSHVRKPGISVYSALVFRS